MFIPNNSGALRVRAGLNAYGEPHYEPARRVPCSVISLNSTTLKTDMRADNSATRGAGEEVAENAKILFPAKLDVQRGMHFSIAGFSLRIIDVQPRFDAFGSHDHNECLLTTWRNEGKLP